MINKPWLIKIFSFVYTDTKKLRTNKFTMAVLQDRRAGKMEM